MVICNNARCFNCEFDDDEDHKGQGHCVLEDVSLQIVTDIDNRLICLDFVNWDEVEGNW